VLLLDDELLLAADDETLLLVLDVSLVDEVLLAVLTELDPVPDGFPPLDELPPEPPHPVSKEAHVSNVSKCNVG